MKEGPLISVLIPYLNSRIQISRCIESVLKQTYENLEIILLDNGSDDGSGKIAASYKDSRIVNLYDPRKDLSCARNRLLEASKGQYLFFLDSDDYIKDNALEVLMDIMQVTASDIVCSSYEYLGPRRNNERSLGDFSSDNKEEIHRYFLTRGRNFNHAWGKLYKKEMFEGVVYPEFRHYEDIDALPKILENAGKVTTTSKALYVYVQNTKGISYNNHLTVHEDGLRARINNCSFYKEKYPGLENEANISAYEFAFFFLGRIYGLSREENSRLRKTVINEVKALPAPRGKGIFKLKVARLITIAFPDLAGKLFNRYSKVKNG